MLAVQVKEFGPPDSVAVVTLPDPEPGPGQVLIDVAAAGLNFPDLLVVAGTYQSLPQLPFVPGKEAAGTVIATGPGVDRLHVGDRVIAMVDYGAFATRLCVAESAAVLIPDEMPMAEAAAFGLVYRTAYFGLIHRGHLQAGETVLITGAGGGVGSAAVPLAKAAGARVIALAFDQERAALATEQGADHVVVCPASELRAAVLDRTDGRGVDVVLDVVGGDVLAEAMRATAWEGRVVIIGFASGSQQPIQPGYLLVKNIAVMGVVSGDYRDRRPELMRTALEGMLEQYLRGALPIPVEATYPLVNAADALRRLQTGRVRGKLVLTTDANSAR